MSELNFTVGQSAAGAAVTADLARLPHLLVAGTTGSGKTTFVHSILTELLETHGPDSLRLLLIDPKRVELRGYRGLPHLLGAPVVTYDEAVAALDWAESEMDRRFTLLEQADVRDISAYNAVARTPLPRIVVVIDELANLILTDRRSIERPLVQIAAMGRAAGIHVLVATQHPSADVLTGLLRANVGARAAFTTVTSLDSRIILGAKGAEALGGRGEMLFRAGAQATRLQGRYVDDAAIAAAVARWTSVGSPTRPWAMVPAADEADLASAAGDVRRPGFSLRPLFGLVRAVGIPALAFGAALFLGASLGVGILAAAGALWLTR